METSKVGYREYWEMRDRLPSFSQVVKVYDEIEKRAANCPGVKRKKILRKMILSDRFFLLTRVLGRDDLETEWHYVMTRMVEAAPDGWLDFWFREGGKTSIITFGGIIQEILRNPKVTICIFSFSRPIAKDLMKPIKTEFENNEILLFCFPEILTSDTTKYERWNDDKGLIVLGGGAGNTCTLEAHGLVEKQPTSKHFEIIVYDDMVSQDTVRTPNASQRAVSGWQLSQNLGRKGGRQWYIGTIYALNGPYNHIKKLNKFKIREFPITYNGEVRGDGPFFNTEEIADKYLTMGPQVFACQNLMKPQMGGNQGFDPRHFNYWERSDFSQMPKAILIDPSGGKNKQRSDFTAGAVIGRGKDYNWYIIDMVRDKLQLSQRTELLFRWHRMYRPLVVAYEVYGMQSDTEHFRIEMERQHYNFYIQETGGKVSKDTRVEGLEPYFASDAIFFPKRLERTLWDGTTVDLVKLVREEEYIKWPFPEHDDYLDMLARIQDIRLDPEDDAYEDDNYEEREDEWEPLGRQIRPRGRTHSRSIEQSRTFRR